jgi:hypothetical protein
VAAEKITVLLRSVTQVHPWRQDGNAKQTNNAKIFQQDTQGNKES